MHDTRLPFKDKLTKYELGSVTVELWTEVSISFQLGPTIPTFAS